MSFVLRRADLEPLIEFDQAALGQALQDGAFRRTRHTFARMIPRWSLRFGPETLQSAPAASTPARRTRPPSIAFAIIEKEKRVLRAAAQLSDRHSARDLDVLGQVPRRARTGPRAGFDFARGDESASAV